MKHDLDLAEPHKFVIEPSLVAAAKGGDRKAWEEICSRSYKPILLYLRYRAQSEETPKDLAQDVFEQAEHSLVGLRDDRCFCAWLYTIARNKFINHRRTHHPRLPLEEGDQE